MKSRPPFQNLRSYARQRVNWRGQVRRDGRAPVPCIVKDISEQGALLEFFGRPPANDQFRLTISKIGYDGICLVRHRQIRTVGVQFTAGSGPRTTRTP